VIIYCVFGALTICFSYCLFATSVYVVMSVCLRVCVCVCVWMFVFLLFVLPSLPFNGEISFLCFYQNKICIAPHTRCTFSIIFGPPAQSRDHQIVKIRKCKQLRRRDTQWVKYFRRRPHSFLESHEQELLEQKYVVSLVSSVTMVMRLPISLVSSITNSHVVPRAGCLIIINIIFYRIYGTTLCTTHAIPNHKTTSFTDAGASTSVSVSQYTNY